MKKRRIILSAFIVGLSSLLYMDFYVENFKFSFAAVIFPLILYMYEEYNPIKFGILSGFSLVLFRSIFYNIFYGQFIETFIYSIPENIFYIVYGLSFYLFKKSSYLITHNKMFIIAALSDTLSNIVEIYIRVGKNIFTFDFQIIRILFLVGIIRAGLLWLMILGYKYYKLILVKEEHDRRYKNLIKLTSRLKTEIYWMEKNMIHIEKVMANAYELFSNIREDRNREDWSNVALEIAKDIHEIKKEYELVVMGIEDIMESRLDNTGMYYSELLDILKESLERDIIKQNKEIKIRYEMERDFYTEKHYYLMSILRNIITNAIDAIEDKGNINVCHLVKNSHHQFIVKDDGCGISGEDLPHIFLPGYSTKIDYSTGQVNRGLGLTIIENLLKVHFKGQIQVESEIGKGSTFKIFIPEKELEGIRE
ncbi:ATP-binding protein [Tepidimicrobium xylanilyticum]|uniref:ATP-binding protein n=1 Tax=Tepidimicrobium xylanilyticum TaxID=1123352 RepID=UPI0026539A5F|nr:ATP-binding protein [Tepidimicrobium xylanilyticum]GMG97452.1 sensor histidine kinase [Tepidimicrobium xylanilyticum]